MKCIINKGEKMRPITEKELEYLKRHVNEQDKDFCDMRVRVDFEGKTLKFWMPDNGGWTRMSMADYDADEWEKAK